MLIANSMWNYVADSINQIEKQRKEFERLTEPLYFEPISPLTEAFYKTQEIAIKTLAKYAGDEEDWLLWYIYDNDYGRNGLEVTINKEVIVMDSLDKLRYVLESR